MFQICRTLYMVCIWFSPLQQDKILSAWDCVILNVVPRNISTLKKSMLMYIYILFRHLIWVYKAVQCIKTVQFHDKHLCDTVFQWGVNINQTLRLSDTFFVCPPGTKQNKLLTFCDPLHVQAGNTSLNNNT